MMINFPDIKNPLNDILYIYVSSLDILISYEEIPKKILHDVLETLNSAVCMPYTSMHSM